MARFISAFITIIIIALFKYIISSGFTIDFYDLFNNIALVLLSWLINTNMINLLTEYFNIKGINFNLRQIFFGPYAIITPSYDTKNLADTINMAMESSESSDKSKGVDREYNETSPTYRDPEDIRRQEVLDGLNRDAARRRSSFVSLEDAHREEQATLTTILKKLEGMRDYNRINHRALTFISKYPRDIDPLTKDEIKYLANLIINDTDALPEVKKKVSKDILVGKVNVNCVIIKYLESKTK